MDISYRQVSLEQEVEKLYVPFVLFIDKQLTIHPPLGRPC